MALAVGDAGSPLSGVYAHFPLQLGGHAHGGLYLAVAGHLILMSLWSGVQWLTQRRSGYDYGAAQFASGITGASSFQMHAS